MSEELDFIALLSSVGDEISVEEGLNGQTGFTNPVQTSFTNPIQTGYDATGKVDFTVSILSPVPNGKLNSDLPAQTSFETCQTDLDGGELTFSL